MSAKLQLDNVTIQFGGLRAVGDLSFSINPGELIGLIGPNGAGKTTVFNLITGVYNPTAGRILFNDIAIPGHKPHQITRLGIARTFQNIRLFPSMSVFDNVRTAMVMHQQHGITHALMRGKGHHDEEVLIEQDILDLLDIFKLRAAAHVECKSLSYGDQRRLEIIRALATKPKLLLLDEPHREGSAHAPDPLHPRQIRHRRAAGGTRHEGGDGHLPAHYRDRVRRQNR